MGRLQRSWYAALVGAVMRLLSGHIHEVHRPFKSGLIDPVTEIRKPFMTLVLLLERCFAYRVTGSVSGSLGFTTTLAARWSNACTIFPLVHRNVEFIRPFSSGCPEPDRSPQLLAAAAVLKRCESLVMWNMVRYLTGHVLRSFPSRPVHQHRMPFCRCPRVVSASRPRAEHRRGAGVRVHPRKVLGRQRERTTLGLGRIRCHARRTRTPSRRIGGSRHRISTRRTSAECINVWEEGRQTCTEASIFKVVYPRQPPTCGN